MTHFEQEQLDKSYLDACERGNLSQVELALLNGANINACRNSMDTALHLCVIGKESCRLSLVELLFKKGIQLDAQNNSKDTALFWACYLNVPAAHLLVELGADVRIARQSGNQPIHTAAANGDLALLQVLVEKGANPDARNSDAATPLYMAAEKKHFHIAAFLINIVDNTCIADVKILCERKGIFDITAMFKAREAMLAINEVLSLNLGSNNKRTHHFAVG